MSLKSYGTTFSKITARACLKTHTHSCRKVFAPAALSHKVLVAKTLRREGFSGTRECGRNLRFDLFHEASKSLRMILGESGE